MLYIHLNNILYLTLTNVVFELIIGDLFIQFLLYLTLTNVVFESNRFRCY